MYVHVYPKKGVAIGPFPEARQDALVVPSTASRTHEICRPRQSMRTAAEQARMRNIKGMCKLDGRDSPRNGLVGLAGPASSMLMNFLTSRMEECLGGRYEGVHNLIPVGVTPAVPGMGVSGPGRRIIRKIVKKNLTLFPGSGRLLPSGH